jgi:hypothetical protein
MILAPEGSAIELEALQNEYAPVAGNPGLGTVGDLKAALTDQMTTADFWEPARDRYETLVASGA